MNFIPPSVAVILLVARIIELRVTSLPVASDSIVKRAAPASFAALSISGVIGVCAMAWEWFLRRPPFILPPFLIGSIFGVASFWLRARARHALGLWWSVHADIREGQNIVQSGPYKYVRHPIYVAAIFELLGAISFFQAWYSGPVIILVYGCILAWRIRAEERALAESMPASWLTYKENTGALLPKFL